MRKVIRGGSLPAVALLTIASLVALPRPLAAQCGSSASSCRNCHEVQKADPVNAKGLWHTAHAFGDFCVFCHSGNTKARDKAAAHAGMVAPLGDVKGSCQSCHPNDFMQRAKKYADVLGKPIGTGTTGGSPPSAKGAAGPAALGPAAPTRGQLIDLNKVYAELDQPRPNTLGNAILVSLIVAVTLVLAGLIFYYEKPVPRAIEGFRRLLVFPAAMPGEAAARPELGLLLPLLSSIDAGTLRAIAGLLSDRENGPRVLKALNHIDLRALAELGENDHRALSSLLTLAKEMKE